MDVRIHEIASNEDGRPPAATISIDDALHPSAAVLRSCYALAEIATFDLSAEAGAAFVRIYPVAGQSTEAVVERFRTALIDFSLREDIETRTKGMRDLIWQTAFGEMQRRGRP